MNICIRILCLFSVGIGTTYCMQDLPKQYHNLDWQANIRTHKKARISDEEYKDTLGDILEYAVDEYERNKGIELSEEDRKIVKLKLYRNAFGYSLSQSQ